MEIKDIIKKYHLIINKLLQKPMTYEEIKEYLEASSGLMDINLAFSKRTFKRDREDIQSIYGIEIKFDFSRKEYFIEYDNDKRIDYLLDAFNYIDAFKVEKSIENFVIFEKNNSKGTDNLKKLLIAIKNNNIVKFQYKKYSGIQQNDSLRKTEPFLLKEFKNRWYLVAKDLSDDKDKVFGLDRIECLQISPHKYSSSNNNRKEFFKDSYGIYTGNSEGAKEIELLLFPPKMYYIKSMPLHESQEIILENENFMHIKLKLHITPDFIIELLSMGHEMKVVSPKTLKDIMIDYYTKSIKLYDK